MRFNFKHTIVISGINRLGIASKWNSVVSVIPSNWSVVNFNCNSDYSCKWKSKYGFTKFHRAIDCMSHIMINLDVYISKLCFCNNVLPAFGHFNFDLVQKLETNKNDTNLEVIILDDSRQKKSRIVQNESRELTKVKVADRTKWKLTKVAN